MEENNEYPLGMQKHITLVACMEWKFPAYSFKTKGVEHQYVKHQVKQEMNVIITKEKKRPDKNTKCLF